MKVVILAGGFGTRISEESHLKPKPMIEIGEKPILWHIMKEYSYYGYNDFVICCGYKQHIIKEWFANYYLYNSDVTFDFTEHNKMEIHTNVSEPWKVTLVYTGLNKMTVVRIKRIQKYIHKKQNKIATMTAVNIGQRFGVLDIEENGQVSNFREKQESDGGVINGGYMVLEPQVFDYIEGDETVFEKQPLEKLAEDGQLVAYRHDGFWKCMDTQRDKIQLENLIAINNAPWMNRKR